MPDYSPDMPEGVKCRLEGLWSDAAAHAQDGDFDAAFMVANQAEEELDAYRKGEVLPCA